MSRVKIKNDPDTILCDKCPKREKCKRLCPAMCRELQKDNQVMERFCSDHIEVYPGNTREIQISGLKPDYFSDTWKTRRKTADDFSEPFPWAVRDHRLRKTTVFIERFFNKTPCKELAERFGVKENTIVYMYKQAVEQLDKIINIMDARKEGIKAVMDDKFTDEEKMFLLASVFGFTQREVGEMFNKDRRVIGKRIKRMNDKYKVLFSKELDKATVST